MKNERAITLWFAYFKGRGLVWVAISIYCSSFSPQSCRNTGEFMMSRYREVAEIVFRYLDHRDRLVRLSITSLLPRIAHFLRDRFVTNYLKVGGTYDIVCLK